MRARREAAAEANHGDCHGDNDGTELDELELKHLKPSFRYAGELRLGF